MEDQQPSHEGEAQTPLRDRDVQMTDGFALLMEVPKGEFQDGDLDRVLVEMNKITGRLNQQ